MFLFPIPRKLALIGALLGLSITALWGEHTILFRISVENSLDHVQTSYVQRFAQALEEEMSDILDVEFYHSAQLYRDRDVVPALARGGLEMAVPGTWQLDRYVPEVSYLLLPQFYGADSAANDQFLSSSAGQKLIRKLESYLNVKIPGMWMDLGAAHLFTTNKKVSSFEDIAGLRIRVAGGEANRLRIEALGGTGMIIPWPDLPPRIADGSVDGVLTTFETVRSASLWEKGLKYAYMDNQYFPQYVPLVSGRIWKQLSPEEQKQFKEIWNRIALLEKGAAQAAQNEARRVAQEKGMEVVSPSQWVQRRARTLLTKSQSQIIRSLGLEDINE